ncbi:MAG: MFS transporter [Kiloniellaceae bacterium]
MLSLSFLRANGRLLTFGMLMTFCSSFGQTYFISLFSGEIRSTFLLSDGDFGSLYSIGTLSSAATLLWVGRLIDRVPLALFSAAVLVGLAAMCLAMGMVSGSLGLVVILFGLRLFGQGLATHSAIVAMGRYFETARGRAVSIAALGHTLGEAIFPTAVVTALALAAWTQIWTASGLALLVLAPLIFLLLKGQSERDRAFQTRRLDPANGGDRALGAALRDPGLWLRLPALLAPSFIFTGLIFHQVHLAETKGWPLSLLAGGFVLFAACALGALIVAGQLVDRFSARRLVPLFLAPLAVACLILAASDAPLAAPAFMALLGINTGIATVLLGALWPELYGITHLGAIRAFGQSAMVFSSGLAPAIMGLLIDRGIPIEGIALACAVYCLVASALAFFAEQAGRPKPALHRKT